MDVGFINAPPPENITILDPMLCPVGTAYLDASTPLAVLSKAVFVTLCEAQESLFDGRPSSGEYSCYLVMLIETDEHTGVAHRLGLGLIQKPSWIAADPVVKLMCLG